MSFPNLWVLAEADDIVRSFPDQPVVDLAEELERSLEAYDQGKDAGRAVVAELRARDAAGVKFWPLVSDLPATSAGLELIDDEIPW